MTQGEIIVRADSGTAYMLGPFLKAGLIGAVYPGLATDGSGRRVAVKLPARNLSPEQQQRFMQEFSVLTALGNHFHNNSPRPVPWIEKGKVVDTGETALVMEFVGEAQLLARQLPDVAKPWPREAMLLEAGRQYARLLVGLHAAGYTCQDRKLTDLRWTEESGGRLVVLDWNVVGGVDKRAEDLHLFGQLWYQLLAGRYPTPDIDPLDDAQWRNGAVSYGTRRLLIKLLANRHETAEDLLQDLQQRLSQMSQDPHNLAGQGRQRYENYKQQRRPDTLPDLDEEWGILDLVDLAYRQTDGGYRAEWLDLQQLVRSQRERLVGGIQHAFRIGQYKQGAAAVRQAMALAEQQQDAHLRLRIARWQLLTTAGERSVQERVRLMSAGDSVRAGKVDLRNIKDRLADWLVLVDGASSQTEADTWESWANGLARLRQTELLPDSETAQSLSDLVDEARLWAVVARVRQAESSGEYTRAKEQMAAMEARLRALSAEYRLFLEAVLPDLQQWQTGLADKAREKDTVAHWDRDLGRILDYLNKTRLPDSQTQMSAEQLMLITDWLTRLRYLEDVALQAELHRSEPDYWRWVIRLAGPLWRDKEADEAVRQRAGEHLRRVRQVMDASSERAFVEPILEDFLSLRQQVSANK